MAYKSALFRKAPLVSKRNLFYVFLALAIIDVFIKTVAIWPYIGPVIGVLGDFGVEVAQLAVAYLIVFTNVGGRPKK